MATDLDEGPWPLAVATGRGHWLANGHGLGPGMVQVQEPQAPTTPLRARSCNCSISFHGPLPRQAKARCGETFWTMACHSLPWHHPPWPVKGQQWSELDLNSTCERPIQDGAPPDQVQRDRISDVKDGGQRVLTFGAIPLARGDLISGAVPLARGDLISGTVFLSRGDLIFGTVSPDGAT